MKILIGSDHRGIAAAHWAAERVRALGHTCEEMLPPDDKPVDYPDYAWRIGKAVAAGESDLGILICHTGIGMSIVANKVPGIRAARCTDAYEAAISRRHNHSNVLCLGERCLDREAMGKIIEAWLAAEEEGGRHARRVEKMEPE